MIQHEYEYRTGGAPRTLTRKINCNKITTKSTILSNIDIGYELQLFYQSPNRMSNPFFLKQTIRVRVLQINMISNHEQAIPNRVIIPQLLAKMVINYSIAG